jgi:hypothetical protein
VPVELIWFHALYEQLEQLGSINSEKPFVGPELRGVLACPVTATINSFDCEVVAVVPLRKGEALPLELLVLSAAVARGHSLSTAPAGHAVPPPAR